jgi:hypothetical protein
MNHVVTSERRNGFRKLGRLKMGVLCSFTILAAPAAGTCDPPPPDITGTWVTKIVTAGNITTPLVPAEATIEAVIRLNITQSGGNFVHKLEICKLATPTKPDPNTLKVSYSPAMLATMVATASIPVYTPTIGGPITVPQFVMQTGSNKVCTGSGSSNCAPTDFVDSDGDGQPGVTLPVVIAGLPAVDAYGALTTTISLSSATLQDAETIGGNAAFSTVGQVLRTTLGIGAGPISVVPSTPTTAVTAKRLAGDVPCSTVAGMFP